MGRNKLFEVTTTKYSTITQCKANKSKPRIDIFTLGKKQQMKQTDKHDWTRFLFEIMSTGIEDKF